MASLTKDYASLLNKYAALTEELDEMTRKRDTMSGYYEQAVEKLTAMQQELETRLPIYPYVMTFSLPADSRYREAVEGAARDLALPIEIAPTGEIRVTVKEAGQMFRFGEEVGARLEAMKP